MIQAEQGLADPFPCFLAAAGCGLLAIAAATVRFGLEAFSRARLLQGLGDGPDSARARYEGYLEHLDRTKVAAALLSAGLETAAAVALAAGIARAAPGSSPLVLGLLLVAFAAAIVSFCRVLPRSLVVRGAEAQVRVLLPALHRIGIVLAPLALPILAFRRGLHRALGLDDKAANDEDFADELIATVAEGEREGAVDETSAEIIENVVDLSEVDVGEVMTPRTDMVWIEANATAAEALAKAGGAGHSRLPVGEGDADHLIGVFYVRDVIVRLAEFESLRALPVREICRKAYFVPETKKVKTLLDEFRKNQLQIAIVLDEYGGTAGLVTIEDVLEAIVGDIVDEYDLEDDEGEVKVLDHDHAEADARAHIWHVNEELGIALPESDDFDTVGGFVFSTLGRMPRTGETIHHDNVELTVLDADERRVKRVEVRVLSRADRGE